MVYYLYVKTHLVTGLKYLGQTKNKDPYKYAGSGKYWLAHLKKHGKTYKTEILKECESKNDLKKWGKYYSDLWNIVNNNEWANLIPETGEGGWNLIGDINPQKRPDVRKKTSEGMKKFLDDNPKIKEFRKKWRNEFWTEEQREKSCFGGLGSVSVIDLNGNGRRISKEEFEAMDRSAPIQQWLFVGAASKEGRRRKFKDHP